MSELGLVRFQQANNVKSPVNKTIKNTKPEVNKAKTNKNTSTIVMSGLAMAGVIGAAILAVKKGQAAKAIKEIGVNKFKEAGNTFVKGKAFTKDGKPFSGIITTIGKDGLKRNIEYTNGVIKEVKTYKPSAPIQGKVYDIPLSKKSYNYNAEGKLESIDKFSWGHVSSKDPQKSGMQYIKTSSTNLDEKRADGLKKFADKQAEIKNSRKFKKQIEAVESQLNPKTKINAQTIDDSFENYESLRNKSSEYDRLAGGYERLEQKEQQIKENVSKLKEKMHQKTEINAQTIDEQFSTTNKDLQELGDYYKGLEAKDAQKAEWKKFATEHPQEAKAIRKAKAAERKTNSLKARTHTERKTMFEYEDYDFVDVVSIKGKGKNATNVTKFSAPDGTLLREISENKNLKNTTSFVRGDKNQKVSVTEHFDKYGDDASYVVKHKVKGKNGKYVDVKRTVKKDFGDMHTADGDVYNIYEKNVYKLENGNSLTEYVGMEEDKILILRDKKGKVLSKKLVRGSQPSPPPDYDECSVFVRVSDNAIKNADKTALRALIEQLEYKAITDSKAAMRLIELTGFDSRQIDTLFRNALMNNNKACAEKILTGLIKKFPEQKSELINLYKEVLTLYYPERVSVSQGLQVLLG